MQSKEQRAAYRVIHKEEISTYNKQYLANNRDALLLKKKSYREDNPEIISAYSKKYYLEHAEEQRQKTRQWKIDNRAKATAMERQRQATKLNATPAWSEKVSIESLYEAARYLTRLTGVQWDVDHEVPLKNKNVCGLHVFNNLRLLPHLANVRKGNRYGL